MSYAHAGVRVDTLLVKSDHPCDFLYMYVQLNALISMLLKNNENAWYSQASSDVADGARKVRKLCVEELKKQAAKLGANGV